MANIVVLGAGLGGTLAAYELRPHLRPDDRLTLIGERSHFEFTPSNPWVAVGWREPADIEVDLDAPMQRNGVRFITEGARRVIPAENRVELRSGESIPYDYLVIATGPDLAFDEIPGFGPSAHTQSVCSTAHAQAAHVALERLCLSPGPVVIGAAQGASCFGPAYEFAYILDTELRRRKLRDRVPMTFVTPEPYIGHLGLDGVGNTRQLMTSELRERQINWITNARVREVAEDRITIEELAEDGGLREVHGLPCHFAMLLPAFRGVDAVRGIDGLVNARGFVIIDEYQRNPTFSNVFSIGVCVAIPPVGKTPVPVGVPKSGFMIESMVAATAENIGSLLRGEAAKARATWNAICLADFGDGGVAFMAQPQIPPRSVDWAVKGRWVHMAKVGFEKYFLHKIRVGESEPFYERFLLNQLNLTKVERSDTDAPG